MSDILAKLKPGNGQLFTISFIPDPMVPLADGELFKLLTKVLQTLELELPVNPQGDLLIDGRRIRLYVSVPMSLADPKP